MIRDETIRQYVPVSDDELECVSIKHTGCVIEKGYLGVDRGPGISLRLRSDDSVLRLVGVL